MPKKFFLLLNSIIFLLLCPSSFSSPPINSPNVEKLPKIPEIIHLHYGSDAMQFGELRLPPGKGPFPVVVLIHGGCWYSQPSSLSVMNDLAVALTQSGVATWNIEYRGANNPGGGWPGTFDDISHGVDFVRIMAPKFHLNLNRIVVTGHSAGGHLALWAAARSKLPQNSLLYSANVLPIRGVVDLAGPGSLNSFYMMPNHGCGKKVYFQLFGGPPTEKPERYQQASPIDLLPLGIKQILITGENDTVVPPTLGEEYLQQARKLNDKVQFIKIKNAGHVELVDTKSDSWPIVKKSIFDLLGIKPKLKD